MTLTWAWQGPQSTRLTTGGRERLENQSRPSYLTCSRTTYTYTRTKTWAQSGNHGETFSSVSMRLPLSAQLLSPCSLESRHFVCTCGGSMWRFGGLDGMVLFAVRRTTGLFQDVYPPSLGSFSLSCFYKGNPEHERGERWDDRGAPACVGGRWTCAVAE